MAGGFPVGLQAGPGQASGNVTSQGVAVATGSTANTMGSYVTLISSTAHDTAWLAVFIDTTNAASSLGFAVNIAVGASGSEKVVFPNLVVCESYQSSNVYFYMLPCSIPGGTRIAAQAQSAVASQTINVTVIAFDDAFASAEAESIADAYGFVSASTCGTLVDPGATAGAYGSYSTIASSLTYDIAGFCLGITTPSSSQPTASGTAMSALNIACGAAGSEKVLVPNIPFFYANASGEGTAAVPGTTPYFPIQVPAGQRIAVNALSQNATSTSRTLGVVFYGVRL